MDTKLEHWSYRLSRAFLIGLGVGGALTVLPAMHPALQGCALIAVGVFAYWRLSNKTPEIK